MSHPKPPPPSNRGARAAILARRARFVSVALAGVGLVAALDGCDCNPMVCLEPAPLPRPKDGGTPAPCLTVDPNFGVNSAAPPAGDASTAPSSSAAASSSADHHNPAGPDSSAPLDGDHPDAGPPPPPKPPPPRVCLSRAPPLPCLSPQRPPPMPCLSLTPPRPPPPPPMPPPPTDVPLEGARDVDDDSRLT